MKPNKARTKTGRRISGVIAWTSLVGIIALPGTLEQETIGLPVVIVLAAVLSFGFAWGAWAAGLMEMHNNKVNVQLNERIVKGGIREGSQYMSYYHTCPICGANLDPGEICEDCKKVYKIKENDKNVRNENHNHSTGLGYGNQQPGSRP